MNVNQDTNMFIHVRIISFYIICCLKNADIYWSNKKDDDNRVKLNTIPDRPDSDFINASYIEVII